MGLDKSFIISRFYFVAALLMLFILGIVIKLINIQIVEGDYYRGLAAQKTVKTHKIAANRGNIYSADGSLLATSVQKYTLRFDAISPSKEDFDKYVHALADSLALVLEHDSEHYRNLLIRARTKRNRYLLIASRLNYSDFLRVKKFPLFNKGPYRGGLIVKQESVREYPAGTMAKRTIGYDRVDPDGIRIGKGIEWSFKNFLAGQEGKQLMQKMAKNQWKPMRDENLIEPKDGLDLFTTIDIHIQDIAHHALLEQLNKYEADHGCVVVMETKTGHIKAISNLGRNQKGHYVERLNYAIQETFEPGSTFKLMSLMALIEDNLADTSTVFDSKGGQIKIYKNYINDSQKEGYGKISLARAFELSSNTVIVSAVHQNYKNDPKKFLSHIYNCRLHQAFDLQIKGAAEPFIPNPTDKKNWSGLSLPWMSWGYGISLTPLHTLTFYNAIANNGVMVKPMFVTQIKNWNKPFITYETEVLNPKICSQATINKLKPMLENVVKKGTANNLFSKNISLAGKTGTTKNAYNPEDKHYVSSFVGYFPVNAPKYSCIVVIHRPNEKFGVYGGDVSGPVFKKIAQKIYVNTPQKTLISDTLRFKKLEDNYAKFFRDFNPNSIPNLVGFEVMDAVAIAENMGLKVKINGLGKVKNQSIVPGSKLHLNQTLYLETL